LLLCEARQWPPLSSVIVGSLAESKAPDSSAPIVMKTLTARELRVALRLPPQP
jgi:hypothetical protein